MTKLNKFIVFNFCGVKMWLVKIKKSANIDGKYTRALIAAAEEGITDIGSFFLERGAKVNAQR